MSKLGKKISSSIDVWSRSDAREVSSVIELDGSDVFGWVCDKHRIPWSLKAYLCFCPITPTETLLSSFN